MMMMNLGACLNCNSQLCVDLGLELNNPSSTSISTATATTASTTATFTTSNAAAAAALSGGCGTEFMEAVQGPVNLWERVGEWAWRYWGKGERGGS